MLIKTDGGTFIEAGDKQNVSASELRLGNWVLNTYANPVQVTVVDDTVVWGKPILLTPELLEKAGFPGRYYAGEDYIATNGKFEILLAHKQLRVGDYVVHDFQYLHQLQNIIFALTGKELEIEINALQEA